MRVSQYRFNRINRKKVLFTIWSLWLLLLAEWAVAEQELVIEITAGSIDATKVAVVPFHWSGQGVLPDDVAEIIGADLERSGRFKSMSRANMLSRPYKTSDVFYEEWRATGMEYLVIGELALAPASGTEKSGYTFNYTLLDVFNGETIEERRGQAVDLRDIAHHISDKIFERLTGVRGAFSTKILYVTVERPRPGVGIYRLQLADADGHRVRTLDQSREPILSPTWSPNGREVAYVSFETGYPAIYLQDIYLRRKQKLTSFKGINGAPDWSPDGSHLAMALSKDGNPEIYILELATKRWTRLTKHYAIDTEPRWSPDGRYLVFTSNRGGSAQIYEYRLADRRIKRLTYEGDYNARGDVSYDGRNLVMVHRHQGRYHIATQDLATGTVNVLTETPLDESPSIAPNGSMLIYATLERGQGILSAVSIDGRVKFRIPSRRGEVREPAWSPFL